MVVETARLVQPESAGINLAKGQDHGASQVSIGQAISHLSRLPGEPLRANLTVCAQTELIQQESNRQTK